MKFALIRETKLPEDNRVALTPKQLSQLQAEYPHHTFKVQSSSIRAFTDDEYRREGISVVDDVSDCDVLFGIKEARIDTLLPNKHYFFFGHIAKLQEYNRPLLQAMIQKKITFSDYEYLVDSSNQRVCAFGWWAGVVGVYYTLRGYGLKYGLFNLPKPDRFFSLEQLFEFLQKVKLPPKKILVTGTGRVSHGVQYALEKIGAVRLSADDYLNERDVPSLSFVVTPLSDMVKQKDGHPFDRQEFNLHPEEYESDFMRWAKKIDILISAHFWGPKDPVYLTTDGLRSEGMHISMIGDITCDIKGSIMSTVRPSTHEDPYYDYNPITEQEEPAFSSDKNITVMAVDTCPNALAMDTSAYFGEMLQKHVLASMLSNTYSEIIDRATIVRNGNLTERYSYMKPFSEGNNTNYNIIT